MTNSPIPPIEETLIEALENAKKAETSQSPAILQKCMYFNNGIEVAKKIVRTHGRCEISVVESYKAFFRAMWDAYCEQEFEMEDAETVVNAAIKHGLVDEVSYDPEAHGYEIGNEWGTEPGEPCYVLTKLPAPEPVMVNFANCADAAIEALPSLGFKNPNNPYPDDIGNGRWALDIGKDVAKAVLDAAGVPYVD